MATGFDSTKTLLSELLNDVRKGKIQLPDFQRGWGWDDEAIRSLIASIAQSFPVGALMMLASGGEVNFRPRQIEGVPEPLDHPEPERLLLDGQQRMTSLYQALIHRKAVLTMNAQKREIRRWYYADMRAVIDGGADDEGAIFAMPENRIKLDFGRAIVRDLSTPEKEYEQRCFPLNRTFDPDEWQMGFANHWQAKGDNGVVMSWFPFQNGFLSAFKQYQMPVITLGKEASREAVCLVFEKVNTHGKKLDAFELLTAIYAGGGFELRKDWYGDPQDLEGRPGRRTKLVAHPVLKNVDALHFLQAICLLHTIERRAADVAAGREGKQLTPIDCHRKPLLHMPLAAYEKHADAVEACFIEAGKFLQTLHIFKACDLPYPSQLTPLAAIIVRLGAKWRHAGVRKQVAQWYWCGVFGELYGSAVESRFAKDVVQVPGWIDGGETPITVVEAAMAADRLRYLRTRNSAAYKGVHALLMRSGAEDFCSGQPFSIANFHADMVDIHHVFPRNWCRKKGLSRALYDSVINKTPLSYHANRSIGPKPPSEYLRAMPAKGGFDDARMDAILRTHAIDPASLRANDFGAFIEARKHTLLDMIAEAMGKPIPRHSIEPDVGDVVEDEETLAE